MPKCSGRLIVNSSAVASVVFVATAWLAPLTRAESVDSSREQRADVVEQRVNGCVLSLTHDKRENFLRYRNRCEQSVAEKGRRLAGLLDVLFPDALPAGLESFGSGRMIQLSAELSQRLAVAAHRSNAWSGMLAARRARGAGDHGMANAVVAKLIDKGDLYREILEPFRARGLSAHTVGIEKVLMAPSTRGPLREWLAEQSVVSESDLPFDAIVWFALVPNERPMP